jgi:hypothetical protein
MSTLIAGISVGVTLEQDFYTEENEPRPRGPLDVEAAVAQYGIENVYVINATPDEEGVLIAMGEAEEIREAADAVRLERRRQRQILKELMFISRFVGMRSTI